MRTRTRSFDLKDLSEPKLLGSTPSGEAQYVSDVGDVNGDGDVDFLVGGFADDHRGVVSVVFGPLRNGESIVLERLKQRGFRIVGAEPEDFAGMPAGGGDINGDGLDDIVVGAFMASVAGRGRSGRVYVVFGKQSTDRVDLADFNRDEQGDSGFRIDGPSTFSLAGSNLDVVEDMNNDGLAEVVIGLGFGGSTYVVFGQESGLAVDLLMFDLNAQGPRGYRIDHEGTATNDGYAVASAGDVNGDGVGDVVIGIVRKDYSGPGKAYVVFGKATPEPVDVASLAFQGLEIIGHGQSGYAVAGAGDVNSDGLDDVVIGALNSHPYLVFGRSDPATIVLRELGRGGFAIKGNAPGRKVAGAGDINGDGASDFLVGDPWASHNGRERSGSVFAIFGKKGSGALRQGRLGSHGFRIDGEHGACAHRCVHGDELGISIAIPGDVNKDGKADILAGAIGVKRDFAGKAHLFWGRR